MMKRIRIFGIVQGVGFRPTLARLATEYGIRGTVSNKGPYVEIFAQADEEEKLTAFVEAVGKRCPKRAVILRTEVKDLEADGTAYADFSIIESEKTKGDILISPDIAICDDCKKELFDPSNKRYLHPFINCTCCGPRLTILDALPYDRERTSMKEFQMCPDCAGEYTSPEDRRYDAQPVCCNDCGPVVYLLDPKSGVEAIPDQAFLKSREARLAQHSAITRIRRTIREGGIAAVKGIGGYHLCCDATNEAAVELLRTRKNRPMKPLAVMARDLAAAKKYCEIGEEEEKLLTGHQKPIILLKKKAHCGLAEAVAPDNPKAGIMLPYAPIQLLLFDYDDGIDMPDALVMTSANESGTPICRSEEDALSELGDLCDAILAHNRRIRLRADDTVMELYEGKPYMIRRSRGYAPLPILADGESAAPDGKKEVVLGIGGELKNSFCIRVGNLFYMSPYIGDMEDVRTVNALKESIDRFKKLLEAEPTKVVCDLHPKYNTTAVAEALGLPVVKIQHHYAHILSCMAENNYREAALGLSFDGTGYGSDQTIWGGEILLADTKGFRRMASIRPFLQIGGNASAREGWRIAVSMIYGLAKQGRLKDFIGALDASPARAEDTWEQDPVEITLAITEKLGLTSGQNASVLMKMYDLKMNAVESTSAGRLFDAVSAILGIRTACSFEGEAATQLQFAAERNSKTIRSKSKFAQEAGKTDESDQWEKRDDRRILPTDILFLDILRRRLEGESQEALADRFHYELAGLAVSALKEIREETGENTVALSGGCFQNTLLLSYTQKALKEEGFTVLRHSLIPPNDGGIALGQAFYEG